MTKRIRTGLSELVADSFLDFSNAIVGNVSDLGAPIRHLRRGNNVVFDPQRALGIRRGYRDITDYVLPYEPHSLAKYYAATNKVFVFAADKAYSVSESTGYTLQTLPVTPSSQWWQDTNVNGVLVVTQEGGSNKPIAYNGTSWLSIVFPTPGAAPTGAAAAGGAVDAGLHKYRIRWLFSNGASLASTTVDVTTAAGNLTAALTVIPVSARSDYLGFQVERTKLLDTTTFYYVGAVLNPATTIYNDTSSDGSLGRIIATEPGPYGQAPHFDHIATFRNFLVGIAGSNLYISQAVADAAPGAGVFNFHPTHVYPVSEDDGDAIVTYAHQVDRMICFKGKSLHALIGFDHDTFQIVPLYRGAGAAGTRAACSNGQAVFFYDGADRQYRMDGNAVRAWGPNQIGHYLADVSASVAAQAKVALFNHLGDKILVAYPSTPSTYNNEVLKYRIVDGRWEHDTNMRIVDALVQARRDDFAGANMIYADPLVRSPAGQQALAANPSMAAWSDNRGTRAEVYVQKVNASGVPQFTANGVLVSASTSATVSNWVATASDSLGSAWYVVWAIQQGAATSDLFINKLDATGASQWPAPAGAGVSLASTGGNENAPGIYVDASNNAYVLWHDGNGTTRVQKISSAGVVQWAAGGIALDTSGGGSLVLPPAVVAPDGAGGLYLAWVHYFGATTSARVTRIDSAGVVVAGWSLQGSDAGSYSIGAVGYEFEVPFCRASDGASYTARAAPATMTITRRTADNVATTSANLYNGTINNFRIIGDLTGGVIMVYVDSTSVPYRIFARRYDSTLAPVWGAWVQLYTLAFAASPNMRVLQDGQGGALLVFDDRDGEAGTKYRPHILRVDTNGAVFAGPQITTNTGDQQDPVACTDGAGGAIIYWTGGAAGSKNVYAQKVSSSLAIQWAAAGVVVCSAATDQTVKNCSFTASVVNEIPFTAIPGYHLWAAYEGFTDARPRNATLPGSAISWRAELPESDAGEPDVIKDLEAIEVHSTRGVATLNVGIMLDGGAISNAVPVQVSIAGAKWGGNGVINPDTLYWGPVDGSHPNNPHTWGGSTGGAPLRTGLPAGMTGRKHSISLSAETSDDLVVNGVVIDYRRRPDRSF